MESHHEYKVVLGQGQPQEVSQSPSEHDQNSPSLPPNLHHQNPVGWSLNNDEVESDEAPDTELGTDSDVKMDDGDMSSGKEADQNPLDNLKFWLQMNYKESLFACGGTVPIRHEYAEQVESAISAPRPASATSQCSSSVTVPSTIPHPPVTLRWDPEDASAPASRCKFTMPPDESTQDNLEHLLSDMRPATFGLGGDHVYDEDYRKASKLDPSNFTTNFCPYKVGIIDVISQLLVPDPDSGQSRAVKAELYNLNVYTGPSGHFHSHVDTPRSRAQFGSLVVCLPVKHEGGALEVRHNDQAMTFDWALGAALDEPQLQWAAFYSDCEHEVLPVLSGHRITLTYNLYVTRGNGQLSSAPNALDVAQTPLYKHLESLVADDTFLPEGGYVGFYTTHSYPHTSSQECLTDTLKGLDMTIWQAFRNLGCGVCLRPILADEPFWFEKTIYKIGKKFEIKELGYIVEGWDDYENMVKMSWGLEQVSFSDVVWLNQIDMENKQASFAYPTYGNEPSVHLSYSVCAIIIGIPKYCDGERMKLETTFQTVVSANDGDWDISSPYDRDGH